MTDLCILIPVYNGGRFLEATLNEINHLGYLDICTFIDDASTDHTASILRSWQPQLANVYFMPQNGQKISTIKKVLELMKARGALAKYIVLTDADTYFYNHDSKVALQNAVDYLEQKHFAAIGLMDVPDKGTLLQKLQYWEYLSDRAMHTLLSRRGHMRCIPGAGGIYQADILLEALQSHSLRHAGDDMETTALIQKLGYEVGYYNTDLQARTRVPHSLKGLVKQRVRWTVGAMETYIKERRFYCRRVLRFNRYSWQIVYETLKLFTYLGWYWALYEHFVLTSTVGWGATYAMALLFAMVNPEAKGQRIKAVFWIIPTSMMIYLVDTVRLPVAYGVVMVNVIPRLEATTSWTNIWRLLAFQTLKEDKYFLRNKGG